MNKWLREKENTSKNKKRFTLSLKKAFCNKMKKDFTFFLLKLANIRRFNCKTVKNSK